MPRASRLPGRPKPAKAPVPSRSTASLTTAPLAGAPAGAPIAREPGAPLTLVTAAAPAVPEAATRRLGSSFLEGRRQSVLDVAERLFAECGLRAVTMQDIAAAAGEPGSAIRNAFGNGDILLQGIIDRHLDTVIDRLKLCARSPTQAGHALAEAIGVLLETLAARPDAARVHIAALNGGGPHLARATRLRQRHVAHLFAGLVAAARPARDADLAMPFALSLLGMCCWHVLWFRPGGALNRADYATLVTTMVLAALPDGPP